LTVYRMQFHAEREELIAYIAGWVGWHGLAVVADVDVRDEQLAC
jgi:hypothetical protein